MKKSEFVKRAVRSMQDSDCAYNLVELAEAAGVEWDPEEPELPKRVELDDDGDGPPVLLVPEGVSWGRSSTDLDIAIAREAAARWNVVSLLLEEYGMATTPKNIGPRLLRILQEEREKLQ